MNMNPSKPAVVCFGEILWDNLPTGRNPGGAPMNVAYHLNKLGVPSTLISAIGDDAGGAELLQFLAEKGVPSSLLQVDPVHKTSEVIASVNAEHEVSYEILSDVAWDYIMPSDLARDAVAGASAFVYGSLSSRTEESKQTLLDLLTHSRYNVFDVNLRAPHYSPELVMRLMQEADLLKVNASELQLISLWQDCKTEDESRIVQQLFELYKMKEIVITKGSEGASYYSRDTNINCSAYKITVQDTIGSGDSFLAAFLAMKLRGAGIEQALDHAVAMGAFITSKAGACPVYDQAEFVEFMKERKAKM